MEREINSRVPSRTDAWLAENEGDELYITFTVLGEMASGNSATRNRFAELFSRFQILSWEEEISWKYGELYRQLSSRGKLIGTNDLWIAATALVNGLPLVTSSTSEFSRVPGLTVFGF